MRDAVTERARSVLTGRCGPSARGEEGQGGTGALPPTAPAAARSAAGREEPRRARSRTIPSPPPPPPPPRRGEGALPREGRGRRARLREPRRGGRARGAGAGAGRGSLAPEGAQGTPSWASFPPSLWRWVPPPPRLIEAWNRHGTTAQGLPDRPGPEPPQQRPCLAGHRAPPVYSPGRAQPSAPPGTPRAAPPARAVF